MSQLLSPDVVWFNVRKNNSFAVKRNKTNFTSEPNNLMNRNTYKYSGLANRRTVDIVAVDESSTASGAAAESKSKRESQARATLVLKRKWLSLGRKPTKAYHKVSLRRDFRRVARTIKNELQGKHYRPDLLRAALARWTKIYQTVKLTNAIKKTKAAAPNKTKTTTK